MNAILFVLSIHNLSERFISVTRPVRHLKASCLNVKDCRCFHHVDVIVGVFGDVFPLVLVALVDGQDVLASVVVSYALINT